MTLNEIRSKILAHRKKLAQLGLKEIIYFGSYARGEQTAHSDLDLIVDFKPGKKRLRTL
jgi:predicted nucleotidyltransferase